MLGFNCLVSALTCIPIFFLARNSYGLRTAVGAAWIWAFFPYAVYFSADSMWSHAWSALFVMLLLLIASHLETRTNFGVGPAWVLWDWRRLRRP